MAKMIKCKQYAKHHIAESHMKTTSMADSQFQASKPVLSIWQESVHKIDSQPILYIYLSHQVYTGLPTNNLSIPVKSIRLISSSAQISVFPIMLNHLSSWICIHRHLAGAEHDFQVFHTNQEIREHIYRFMQIQVSGIFRKSILCRQSQDSKYQE